MSKLKLKKLTKKEIKVQIALGILPEEYRNNLCRHKTPEVSKGHRTCHLCGLKCIHKGEEFYLIDFGRSSYSRSSYSGSRITINICKSCSWMTTQTINKIINVYNISK